MKRGNDKGALSRFIARLIIAIGTSALISVVLFVRVPWTISGKNSATIGYELYADFNVNKYLDAYYLAGLLFPLTAMAIYAALHRFGPLRSRSLRTRPEKGGPIPEAFAIKVPTDQRISTLLRVLAVGSTLLLLEIAIRPFASSDLVAIVVVGVAAYLALIGLLLVCAHRLLPKINASHLNSIGAISTIALLAKAASHTAVKISSTGKSITYDWFPVPIAIAAILFVCLFVARWRKTKSIREIERLLLTYVAAPIALLCCLAGLPGTLGNFSFFIEGENLAGGWLMFHRALPWINLIQIHGALDDGLRAILGFEVFGSSRWGSHAGNSMFIVPMYWVSIYLFAATLFKRRPALLVASLIAIIGGVLTDWDARLLLWPVALIALTALIKVPNGRRSCLLAGIAIVQIVLVPEALFGLPPLLITLFACDVSERSGKRLVRNDLRRTSWFVFFSAIFSMVFFCYLALFGGFTGFIDYFKDFADSHAATSGIPFFRSGFTTTPLGLRIYNSRPPGIFSSGMVQLWLPLVLIVCTVAVIACTYYRNRRLLVEHWVTITAAGWTLLWLQEPASRGDSAHIGYAFAATTPLILLFVAIMANALEDQCRRWRDDARARFGLARKRLVVGLRVLQPSHSGLAVIVLLLFVTPITVPRLLARQNSSLHPVVPRRAPAPVVAGGPSLGYNVDAIGANFASDLNNVITRYAGKSGDVFDFSNAPGFYYFLLNRRPGTLLYDINEADSPAAQQLIVNELKKSHPSVVIWSGFGASAKDEIPNEVRYYIVSRYLLAHYRPVVTVDKEHLLIADSNRTAPSPSSTKNLDLSEYACVWGDIPNFLISTIPHGTTQPVALHEIKTLTNQTIYAVRVPHNFSTSYSGITITRSSNKAAGKIALSDILGNNDQELYTHEIDWVDLKGTSSTGVEVGSCLQWQGYSDTLLISYTGPGRLTSASLYRG